MESESDVLGTLVAPRTSWAATMAGMDRRLFLPSRLPASPLALALITDHWRATAASFSSARILCEEGWRESVVLAGRSRGLRTCARDVLKLLPVVNLRGQQQVEKGTVGRRSVGVV